MVGDINGDEYDDFLIGSPDSISGGYQSGQIYILFGKESGWQIDLILDQADASIIGQEWDEIGEATAAAGDVNADGYDDFLFNGEAGPIGEIYLVLGRDADWQLNAPLDSADAAVFGDPDNDFIKYSAGGGDMNGDGYDDFLIASEHNSVSVILSLSQMTSMATATTTCSLAPTRMTKSARMRARCILSLERRPGGDRVRAWPMRMHHSSVKIPATSQAATSAQAETSTAMDSRTY